jgi:hypothetical protein
MRNRLSTEKIGLFQRKKWLKTHLFASPTLSCGTQAPHFSIFFGNWKKYFRQKQPFSQSFFDF